MKLKQLVDRMMVYLQRRGGRVAEGAPLLREYGFYRPSRVRIPLSPPFHSKSNSYDLSAS